MYHHDTYVDVHADDTREEILEFQPKMKNWISRHRLLDTKMASIIGVPTVSSIFLVQMIHHETSFKIGNIDSISGEREREREREQDVAES